MPQNTSVAISLQPRPANLYLMLAGLFLTNALIAEFVGVKIFSFEGLLGIAPFDLKFTEDLSLSFNLTAGVIIWPVVFLSTDVINEYFGHRGVRKVSIIAALFIAYSFVVVYLVTQLPPAPFWLDLNQSDPSGNTFNINFAFSKVFGQGLGIMIGSIGAFLIGQLIDAYSFRFIKKLTGSKKIWLRATGSTLISQLIDSFVVLFIAFFLFGNWPLYQVLAVGLVNYIYKFLVALLLTPLIYLGHFLVEKYLGSDKAKALSEEALGQNPR